MRLSARPCAPDRTPDKMSVVHGENGCRRKSAGCIPKWRMRKPCKNRRQALLAELASSLQLIGRGVHRQSVRASVRD
ncbi:MAG: hypothetical protein RLY70_3274, partial [Planctomycetota bacterium]